jgi:plastocyanin
MKATQALRMSARQLIAGVLCTCGMVLSPVATQAAETVEVQVVIKNHRFEPAELRVPAGQKVKLVVHNQDATPEEFESNELKREKVIPAGAKTSIFVGPLAKGRYPFFGEFNQTTAQGVVIAE